MNTEQECAPAVQGEPVAWISRVKIIGPEYGKEYFDRMPIQSLNPLAYEHVPLYTAPQPAEQQPFEWPRLDRSAKVGATCFHKGVSSRLVIEAAQRQYDYDATPEKEAERKAKFVNFRKEVLQPALDAAGLVKALEELVDLVEDIRKGEYIPDSFTTQPARIALAAYRKGGEK